AGAGQERLAMKADAFQVTTDRIIGLLEKGVVPWQKPWRSGQQMPRNLISKKDYRGVNVFLLHAMMYESPYWLTFNQAKELGGYIKQGEKACPVVFWKWLDVPDADKPTGKKAYPSFVTTRFLISLSATAFHKTRSLFWMPVN